MVVAPGALSGQSGQRDSLIARIAHMHSATRLRGARARIAARIPGWDMRSPRGANSGCAAIAKIVRYSRAIDRRVLHEPDLTSSVERLGLHGAMVSQPVFHGGTDRVEGCWAYGCLRDGIKPMRKVKSSRPRQPAKKAGKSTLRRRQARKKSASPMIATTAKHVEEPVVVAPPRGIASPFLFWPAFPIAMMRMWFGPRAAAAGK
jgi:hypothetical protein